MSKTLAQFNKIVFILVLFFAVFNPAMASDKKEVEQAYYSWCTAIGTAKGDAAQVVKYYGPNAILLPTLSPKILMNKNGGLNAYFTKLTSEKNIKCTPQKLITRIYGDVAVNAGLYTFSLQDSKGKNMKIPARFSFVYQKIDKSWMIINHHSSKLPD